VSNYRHFSWILDDRLAVGAAPTRYDVLVRLGFSAALSLQEANEDGPEHGEAPKGFVQAQVPIRDGIVGGIPSVDQIAEAVERLRELLDNHVVYVHCFAGVGRSPLVCAAYLARHHGMEAAESLAFVRDQHRNADPTDGQIAALKRYLDPTAPE
jgi:protein-tyrosine phosphatase